MDSIMRISYVKRYKMEVSLEGLAPPRLPEGFHLVRWSRALVEPHAEVLYTSFVREIDARVFPSLGDRLGCERLILDICRRPGFIPEATWLAAGPEGFCGTIQAIAQRGGLGAIQNVGIIPAARGRGIGSALILQALHGFRQVGLCRGMLEVTAENEGAIRLYWRLGFRRTRTLYKTIS